MDKQYKPIPAYKPDTCKNCKGHGVEMLDNEYTDLESRNLLVKVIGNYVDEKNIATS